MRRCRLIATAVGLLFPAVGGAQAKMIHVTGSPNANPGFDSCGLRDFSKVSAASRSMVTRFWYGVVQPHEAERRRRVDAAEAEPARLSATSLSGSSEDEEVFVA